MCRTFCTFMLAALICVGSARADRAIRKPADSTEPKNFNASLVVELRDEMHQPELHVPRSLMKTWQQAAAPLDGDYRLADASLSTMLAGLALTLSFGCGGVWLARRHGLASTKTLALWIATLAIAGFTVANVFADEALPRSIKRKGSTIKVVVVPKGDAIKLILPKAEVDKLTDEKK